VYVFLCLFFLLFVYVFFFLWSIKREPSFISLCFLLCNMFFEKKNCILYKSVYVLFVFSFHHAICQPFWCSSGNWSYIFIFEFLIWYYSFLCSTAIFFVILT
jgi:hypothetical protein